MASYIHSFMVVAMVWSFGTCLYSSFWAVWLSSHLISLSLPFHIYFLFPGIAFLCCGSYKYSTFHDKRPQSCYYLLATPLKIYVICMC
ncbi:hypothetical protein K402DRAFT_101775 [Aulographum hederae CBS 113979]|uniref:Uncharacterized protein n=1 Tax=Aulographum hederae CBS 113979 TaxID=1176131 RepID=A0A6G1GY27_9PEZI|nr:hypothetical protein K402DRAFT_101775 [Aulographum hederae CBS 113979]